MGHRSSSPLQTMQALQGRMSRPASLTNSVSSPSSAIAFRVCSVRISVFPPFLGLPTMPIAFKIHLHVGTAPDRLRAIFFTALNKGQRPNPYSAEYSLCCLMYSATGSGTRLRRDKPCAARSLMTEALISIRGLSSNTTRFETPGILASRASRLGR
jgi:hypothetical protein